MYNEPITYHAPNLKAVSIRTSKINKEHHNSTKQRTYKMNHKRTDSLVCDSGINATKLLSYAALLSSLLLGACSIVPGKNAEPPVMVEETSSSESKEGKVETPVLKSASAKERRSGEELSVNKGKEKATKKLVKQIAPKKKAKKLTAKKQKALVVVKKETIPKTKKKTLKSKSPKKQTTKAVVPKEDSIKTEVPKSAVSDMKTPKIAISLNNLPFSIGDDWEINRSSDVNPNTPINQSCALSYKTLLVEDGQGATPVILTITGDKIVVKTKSNIDSSYKNTGIAIDDMTQLPIEKLLNEFSISYEQGYQSLIDKMQTGKLATISLGFWPTWPITHARSVQVDLMNFPQAYLALQSCMTLESKLK